MLYIPCVTPILPTKKNMLRRDFLRSKQHTTRSSKSVTSSTRRVRRCWLAWSRDIWCRSSTAERHHLAMRLARLVGGLEHGFDFFFHGWEWNGIIPTYPNWRISVFERGRLNQQPALQEMFSYILLPMVIFAAGFNLDKHRFFRFGGYIAALGITGTVAWSARLGMARVAKHNWNRWFRTFFKIVI